jgi:putative salt-induced outer membrane protein YdiY
MKLLTPTIVAAIGLFATTTFSADNAEPKWESSAAAGLTLTRGNSDTVLGTINLSTARKWDQHELSFGSDVAYGQSTIEVPDDTTPDPNDTREEDETTASSIRGFGQYNYLFNERLYGYGRLEALHDDVAKVDYRVTLSPGAGYYLIKEKEMNLSVEAGPGYIFERLDGEEDNYFVLRVAEKFEYKISERARLWQSAELLPQVEDFNNYLINFELGIEADLTESLSLRSFIQDTYDNQPAEGRDKNDLKWVTAIAYKF